MTEHVHQVTKRLTNKKNLFLLSLADQALVSAGNFLTILLGAQWLSLADQGILVTLYTVYIGLVLLNIACFFASANTVVRSPTDKLHYKRYLHDCFALYGAILVCGAGVLGWSQLPQLHFAMTNTQYLLGCILIVTQAMIDFSRRADYIFDQIAMAVHGSLITYGLRIVLMVSVHPTSLEQLLWLMVLMNLPVCIRLLIDQVRDRQSLRRQLPPDWMAATHWRLSWWTMIGTPFKWGSLHLPVLLTASLHSLQAAAILGGIRAITTFTNVFFELFETIIPKWLAAEAQHGRNALKHLCIKVALLGLAGWAVLASLFWYFDRSLLSLLLGARFAPYTPVLHLTWLCILLTFWNRVISLYYRSQQNTRMEFLATSIGLIALLPCLSLIQTDGAIAGAATLALIQLSTLLVSLAYSWVKR